jgi:hypothetical protein
MVYYIFKTEESNPISYGYVPSDKVSEQDREQFENSAFAILESLPPVPAGSETGRFSLDYNEETEEFFWVEQDSIEE